MKGEKNPNYGKKASPETRRKSSKARLGMIPEAFTVLVNSLLKDGWTKTKISQHLRVSRHTVHRYAKLTATHQ